MNFESFYNKINEIDKKINLKNKNLVMHFRIGTSGKNDKLTCHPYPITNKTKYLKSTNILCQLGMVHNGIISSYAYENKENLNDTQKFVKDFVSYLYNLNRNFLNNSRTYKILSKACNYTKLCFLDKNDNVFYIGEFENIDGVKFSNSSYLSYNYKNYNCYDYYDYYDNNFYYLAKNKVAILNDSLYYESQNRAELIQLDENFCIDIDNNLYQILYEYKSTYELELIEKDVIIYDESLKSLGFEDFKKVGVVKDE